MCYAVTQYFVGTRDFFQFALSEVCHAVSMNQVYARIDLL